MSRDRKRLAVRGCFRLFLVLVSVAGAGPLATGQQSVSSQAETPHAQFRNSDQFTLRFWNTQHGLPQNCVNDIVQSDDGHLWLATQNGLARFDGTEFTNYDALNTPELGCNRISRLLVASNGDLWIGTTRNGVVRLRDGEFSSFRWRSNAPGPINTMAEDRNGTLWFGGDTLCKFDGRQFERVECEENRSLQQIHSLHPDDSGESVWAATEQGLFQVQGKRATAVLDERGQPIRDACRLIFRDGSGLLTVLGTRQWIVKRDGQVRELAAPPAWRNGILATADDPNTGIWAGGKNGLYHRGPSISPAKKKQKGLERFEIPGNGNSVQIKSLLADRDGNIWAGTRLLGLVRLTQNQFRLIRMPSPKRHRWSMPFLSPHDEIWLAFPESVYCWSGGKWQKHPGVATPDEIRRTCTTEDGAFWVAHKKGHLSCFHEESWRHYRHDLGRIEGLMPRRAGGLWLVSQEGLSRFDGNRFETVSTHATLRSATDPVSFCESDSGELWIGTSESVGRLRDGKWEAVQIQPGTTAGEVRSLHLDGDGVLWIATYGGGLLRWENGSLAQFTTSNGLPDNSLGRILQDGPGNLWINSNRGVIRLSREELNAFAKGDSESYYASLLPTPEGNGISGGYLGNGRLWFPTVNGLVTIDPSRYRRTATRPHVSLEQVLVNDEARNIRGPLRMLRGDGDLEFRFTSPCMNQPDRTRYRYRLEGYDRKWINAGSRRAAFYTGVPTGTYRFRVTACNANGIWSEHEAELSLVLQPAFYQTRWFYGLMIFAVLLAAGAGVWSKTRTARIRNALIQQSEERMELTLRGARLGTWDWNVSTGEVTYNARWAEMFGYSADEIEPRPQTRENLIFPDDLPEVRKKWQEHLEGSSDYYQSEIRMQHRSGRCVWVLEDGQVIQRNAAGRPLRICGTIRDITIRKKLEEQVLRQHSQMADVSRLHTMGEMAAGLAHEVNQPLAAMSNYCYVGKKALEKNPTPDPGFFSNLFVSLEHMTSRIAGIIREMNRLAGRRNMDRTAGDLTQPIEEVLELLSADIRRAGASVQLDLGDFEQPALINEVQIQQVLANLIRNSLDAMADSEPPRVLGIKTGQGEEGTITVSVSDTGCGIPAAESDRVFDAFFSNKRDGMGMGLAISRTIIELHGGRMWFTRNADRGVTFHVTLPLAAFGWDRDNESPAAAGESLLVAGDASGPPAV